MNLWLWQERQRIRVCLSSERIDFVQEKEFPYGGLQDHRVNKPFNTHLSSRFSAPVDGEKDEEELRASLAKQKIAKAQNLQKCLR